LPAEASTQTAKLRNRAASRSENVLLVLLEACAGQYQRDFEYFLKLPTLFGPSFLVIQLSDEALGNIHPPPVIRECPSLTRQERLQPAFLELERLYAPDAHIKEKPVQRIVCGQRLCKLTLLGLASVDLLRKLHILELLEPMQVLLHRKHAPR